MQRKMERRDFLKGSIAAGAAAALGASCAACASRGATGDHGAAPRLRLGVSTLGFDKHTNADLARELAAERVRLVQLFLSQTDSRFWKYNGYSDVSSLTPERCRAIAGAYRSSGIEIHSIGVYTNLIHPQEGERRAAMAYFEAMMKAGAEMGVRTFVTEAGHYHGREPEPPVPLHFQESVWAQMVSTFKALAETAGRYDATVLLEPFFRGFLATAKRMRVFLEEVNSPRIKALLDPANLLEVNDLNEMFDQLGPRIECLHAKDRKLHVDRGVPAGQGDLDYDRFLKLASERTPSAPLVLEYVGPKDYRETLAHVRAAMKRAGIEEA
jgi:sugar phosphate isomerase/epimerase